MNILHNLISNKMLTNINILMLKKNNYLISHKIIIFR